MSDDTLTRDELVRLVRLEPRYALRLLDEIEWLRARNNYLTEDVKQWTINAIRFRSELEEYELTHKEGLIDKYHEALQKIAAYSLVEDEYKMCGASGIRAIAREALEKKE